MTVALAALSFQSCVKTEMISGAETQTVEPGFALTRAETSAPVADQDGFTLMAYHLGAGTETAQNQVQTISYGQPYGYYAYDQSSGELIPVAVSGSYPYKPTSSPLAINRGQAMRLTANTSDANQTGVYRVAMVHPALPVRNANALGLLAVYNLGEKVYASWPDDADGAGEPFEIKVKSNQEVHPIPDNTKLYPIQAQVQAYLYTTESRNYTVESAHLVNAGNNGWYNARTGVVYPNYNYNSKTSYSAELSVPTGNQTANYLLLTSAVDGATAIPNAAQTAQYKINAQDVFPTDYRGTDGDAQGDANIMPMTLALKLDMNPGGGTPIYNNASVPIALKIERDKRYTFYIDVQSASLSITYQVFDWDTTQAEYDENTGSGLLIYGTVTLNAGPGDWDTTDAEYSEDNIG